MILSICIPTYNRSKKALLTVHSFYEQILRSEHKSQIELIVSNNGSTDSTAEVLAKADLSKINFKLYNQTQNLGFDGNTRFLYENSTGQYVWYFGDDDILFENAVDTVFNSIHDGRYGGMRFAFMQPKGSSELIFKYPGNELVIITDINAIIECCFTLPKVTTYVLKRVEPVAELFDPIKQYEGGGYWFIALSVRVFEMLASKSAGLVMYNKQLASSDDDVYDLRVEPEVWNNRAIIADYPFVKLNAPTFKDHIKKEDYIFMVLLLWKYKKGDVKVHDPAAYDLYIKDLEIDMKMLNGHPLSLYWLLILKLNLLPLHNKALHLVKKLRGK